MPDNNTVIYEEYLDIENKPNKEDQDILVEMAKQGCAIQIAGNALRDNHLSVEKKDLGNGKTRVTVSMRLVPPAYHEPACGTGEEEHHEP